MALLSSSTLIRVLNIFHLTLVYYLLADPSKLINQNLVLVLGSSMRLPRASPLPLDSSSPVSALTPTGIDPLASPNAATSLAALFLAVLLLSDTTAAFLSVDAYEEYWSAQGLARVTALFGLEAWIYLSKPPIGMMGTAEVPAGALTGVGAHLKNDLVFTWAFLEFLWTFWLFLTLREERRQTQAIKAQKKGREEGIY